MNVKVKEYDVKKGNNIYESYDTYRRFIIEANNTEKKRNQTWMNYKIYNSARNSKNYRWKMILCL